MTVVLGDPSGLHARPAARIVDEARASSSAIRLRTDKAEIALDSMVGLLALGLGAGAAVTVRADGPDADQAVHAIASLLAGPGSAAMAAGESHQPSRMTNSSASAATLQGMPASPGRATGVIRHLAHVAQPTGIGSSPNFQTALEMVATNLRTQADQAGREVAEVLSALAELALDPRLAEAVRSRIASGLPVREALIAGGDDLAAVMEATADPYIAARASDIRHIANDAALLARGQVLTPMTSSGEKWILVAKDISPALLASLAKERLAGVVTEEGSPTSHASLIASSLTVPMIVAMPDALARLEHGAEAGIDGATGAIELDLASFRRTMAKPMDRATSEPATPVFTLDGHRVPVAINVSSLAELRRARSSTVDGVGLYRTELSYLAHKVLPSQEELANELRHAVTMLNGQRFVVRTFDFGSDKAPPFMNTLAEPNPALGVRGMRFTRAHPELLTAQLWAVAQASELGPVSVMAPMVTTLDDVHWFTEQVRRHISPDSNAGIGVMIEVPAAALAAAEISRQVDFVSIGTNDLLQYLNAADRQLGNLADLQDPFTPVLLRLLSTVCVAAKASGTRVCICGAAASDPNWAVLAIGLGVDELSVPPTAVAGLRHHLGHITTEQAQDLARQALLLDSAANVRQIAKALLPTLGQSAT
jgi:phosphoenolpyruvate-protein phosphotransferase